MDKPIIRQSEHELCWVLTSIFLYSPTFLLLAINYTLKSRLWKRQYSTYSTQTTQSWLYTSSSTWQCKPQLAHANKTNIIKMLQCTPGAKKEVNCQRNTAVGTTRNTAMGKAETRPSIITWPLFSSMNVALWLLVQLHRHLNHMIKSRLNNLTFRKGVCRCKWWEARSWLTITERMLLVTRRTNVTYWSIAWTWNVWRHVPWVKRWQRWVTHWMWWIQVRR